MFSGKTLVVLNIRILGAVLISLLMYQPSCAQIDLSKKYNDQGCDALVRGQDVSAEHLFVSAYNEAQKSGNQKTYTLLLQIWSHFTVPGGWIMNSLK